ncbi:hypothetical protein [Thiomicrospira microaerophila]|uniref:hypothetical protein n=1 Tax=Thiomicrospira microaerophila TaxID=406020 RepID=UPI0005CAB036|nr:hypothetical protein [Thiomicrospira microaerophila]
MKRRYRESSIFNMSALDLFASALGAVILIMVILLPYYLKTAFLSPEDLHVQLQIAEKKLKELEEANQELTLKSNATFLLISLSWSSEPDIDLFVRDPHGNLFNFNKHNRLAEGQNRRPHFQDSLAELSVDATRGPASEIWMTPVAEVGRYEVYYSYYSAGTVPAVLQGRIFHSHGIDTIKPITLRGGLNRRGIHVATVYVNEAGEISVVDHI